MDLEQIIGHIGRPTTDFDWINRIHLTDENNSDLNNKYDLGITFIDGQYLALIIDNQKSTIISELTYAREKYNLYQILQSGFGIKNFDEILEQKYKELTNK